MKREELQERLKFAKEETNRCRERVHEVAQETIDYIEHKLEMAKEENDPRSLIRELENMIQLDVLKMETEELEKSEIVERTLKELL